MKLSKYIVLFVAGALGLSSCKKEFLDEKPPTALPVTESIKTETDLADAVNGMYNAMRQYTLFGRDVPVLGDELGDNIYIYGSNSGRYLSELNLTYINSNAEASDIWTQGYYAILQANRIIYAANSMPTSNAVNQLRGEAYTARALNYLTLVNFFATPYNTNPNAAGVPLVTTPTFVTGPFIKPSRATVAAVYSKIISDLDSAYTTMPATVPTIASHAANSEYGSKWAARALEARAYLYKADYANAIVAARDVVQNGGYTLAAPNAYVAYWANPAAVSNKTETIFELALTNQTNNGTSGLDYIYNQNGYGDAIAYDALYNLYSATDVRKNLFTTYVNKPGAAVVNKYTNVSNANDKDDIKIIRYSEVLLTLAEAYARTGDNTNAQTYVNMVAKQRDPAFVGYISTGSQLADDIVTERRKELAFEGLRYFDLQRLGLTVTRPAQVNSAPVVNTFAPDNFRRILPIPQSETDINPNIKQNAGY